MVFYLKYRPQKLAELDLKKVRKRLTTVVSAGRIPHAFLFVGPKGTGKTSAARIIAKIINCQERRSQDGDRKSGAKNAAVAMTGKQKPKVKGAAVNKAMAEGQLSKVKYEPCNSCDICNSITNGSNLDVLEIDAASNRGIDEIRKLREGIKLTPVSATAKVYIIDEVHMLTTEAFNALLKTIEEPPSHAYFILATTEPKKIPETITSRCFRVEFERASQDEIVNSLQRVVKGEELNIDREALALIARYADGSFRDAVKILEEASLDLQKGDSNVKKNMITEKQVRQILGVVSGAEERLIKYLADKRADKALKLIQELASRGINFSIFTKKLIDRLHQQLLASYGLGAGKQMKVFSQDQLIALMRLLSQTLMESKFTPVAQLPLEMAVVEWCSNEVNGKGGINLAVETDKLAKGGKKLEIEGINTKNRSDADSEKSKKENNDSRMDDFHSKLIEAVKPINHTLAGVLRGCQQLTIDGNTVIIKVPYQFHYERLKDAHQLLSKAAGSILGQGVKIEITRAEGKSGNEMR